MATYKELMICNKDYDGEAIIKNDLLHEGGIAMSNNAGLFLEQAESEGDEFYNIRLKTAFDPIYANVLDRIKSLLFSKPLSIVSSADSNNPATVSKPLDKKIIQFLHEFEKNCDGRGTSFHNFCKKSFEVALRHGRAITMVDYPRIADEYKNKNISDQLTSGELKGYLINIPLISVLDWERNELGDLVWIKIFTKNEHRDAPLAPLMCLYRWITLSMGAEEVIVVNVYQKDINLDQDQKLQDEDVIPQLPEAKTTFKTLNTVELSITPGLALGNVIAPAVEQLFVIDSYINAGTIKNTISLPIYKAGNNLQTPHDGRRAVNIVQMDPNRFKAPQTMQQDRGWHVIGKDDSVEILETEGKAIATLQEQRKVIIERINAAAHQVAQNIMSRGQQAQSAAAKQEDRRDTEIVLNEYKLEVESYAVKIIILLLQLIKQNHIELHVEGLNVEDDIDRKDILEEVVAYGSFPDSEIFKINFEYSHALDLLTDDLSDDDKKEMRKQIERSVRKKINAPELQVENKAVSAASQPSDNSENKTGPAGQALQPNDSHLQTGIHVDSQVVFDQLAKDYKEKDIGFVMQIPWIGPVEVPLLSIDFSNKDNWQASQPEDAEYVNNFATKMKDEQFNKPIILVNNPSNDNKMMVVDGHHRALAAQQIGQPINAYVGQIGSNNGPWDKLHGKQVGDELEKSLQKDVSKQVDESEK